MSLLPLLVSLTCILDVSGHFQSKRSTHSSFILHATGTGHLVANAPSTPLDKRSGGAYWSGKNGNTLRTGSTAAVAPRKIEAGPSWSWIAPNKGIVRAAPIIDGERNIYLATIPGQVIKFTPDGQQLWNYSAGAEVSEVPVLDNGRLFIATATGEVISLDPSTGAEGWRVKVGKDAGGDTWSMTAGEGVVVSGANQGNDGGNIDVVAMDAATGAELWRFTPDDKVYNFLASIKDGHIIFSDCLGTVYKRHLKSGTPIWQSRSIKEGELSGFTTGGTVLGPDNVVYVTANLRKDANSSLTGRLTAMSFADGKKLWSTDVPMEANNAAAVGRLGPDGKGPLSVVIGIGENPDWIFRLLKEGPNPKKGQVLAFDAKTGAERWTFTPPVWPWGPAAGDLPDHICLPDSFSNPSIGGDGTVYIGFENGVLYSLFEKATADGKVELEHSEWDTKNAFQGSAGIAPDLLVATPCNGMHVWKSF